MPQKSVDIENMSVQRSADWLEAQLSSAEPECRVLIVDIRPASDFKESHIRSSVNLCLPASNLMLRRLVNGKMPIAQCVSPNRSREKFVKHSKSRLITLVYNPDARQCSNATSDLDVIYKKLIEEGCQCVCLEG